MKSLILEHDHNDLIELNRSLSAEERLIAFDQHCQLISQLSLIGSASRSQAVISATDQPPLIQS